METTALSPLITGNETARTLAFTWSPDESRYVSQPFPVESHSFYLASIWANNPAPELYAVRFFNREGGELPSDSYGQLDGASGGALHHTPFQARRLSTHARIDVCGTERELSAPRAQVRELDREETLGYMDEGYAALPPLDAGFYPPAPERFRYMPRTLARLRAGSVGRHLRVVLLGDSVANDTGNSLFHLLIERQFPGARIDMETSVRGGGGCLYYRDPAALRQNILNFQPELVLIGGISHGNSVEAIAAVIEATRDAIPAAEFLVTNGGIRSHGMTQEVWAEPGEKVASADADAHRRELRDFAAKMAAAAPDLNAAFLDTYAAWDRYIAGCGRDARWYQRDYVHANDRGRIILGRSMAGFFAK